MKEITKGIEQFFPFYYYYYIEIMLNWKNKTLWYLHEQIMLCQRFFELVTWWYTTNNTIPILTKIAINEYSF